MKTFDVISRLEKAIKNEKFAWERYVRRKAWHGLEVQTRRVVCSYGVIGYECYVYNSGQHLATIDYDWEKKEANIEYHIPLHSAISDALEEKWGGCDAWCEIVDGDRAYLNWRKCCDPFMSELKLMKYAEYIIHNFSQINVVNTHFGSFQRAKKA